MLCCVNMCGPTGVSDVRSVAVVSKLCQPHDHASVCLGEVKKMKEGGRVGAGVPLS